MLDVIIISNYWHFPNEKSSSRYHSIASLLAKEKMSVEVITSRFYHTKKQYRESTDSVAEQVEYKTTLIEENQYNKNISINRIFAHRQFAKNVIGYLFKRKKPDVIYLFVPPTGLAKKVVNFANKNNIKIIIDILDLWPEAFEMLLPKAFSKLLFPMKRSVEYAYRNADKIVAVSKGYAQRAAKLNKKDNLGTSIYIGTDLFVFDEHAKSAPLLNDKLRPITMAYIGMLGKSYNLTLVMQAMKELIDEGYDNIEFLVMGNGPMQAEFEKYALKYNLPVRFTGRLSYEDMIKKLVKSDIGINILQDKSVASIVNKHADYLAAGIPIINMQKDEEFSNLLIENNAGLVCPVGDINSLKIAIKQLAENLDLRKELGLNSRQLAEKYFDRATTYSKIIDLIKECCK